MGRPLSRRRFPAARLALAAALAFALAPQLRAAPPEPGERISFVSCPIIRDTRTVPCWLSEYEGDTYYLTIQSDVSAAVQPPMLGHQVLVEGIVTDAPAICGGIVLDAVRLSVMPELDANCRTVLPVEEGYTVDFNPRPPGPSAGRLAFDPGPAERNTAPAPPPEGPQVFDLYFDFEKSVSFRHPNVLISILGMAEQLRPSRLRVTGVRGAHLLSDGTLLRESELIGQRRAEDVARLLQGAGLEIDAEIEWTDGAPDADGVDDWQSRRATVVLEP